MAWIVKCEECEIDIKVYPDRYYNRKNFFCSKKCEGIYKRKICKTKIECNCDVCDKEMFVKKSQYERRHSKGRITCSTKCLGEVKKKLYLGRNNPNCRYKTFPDRFFKNIDSEDKSYILGWIASDGNINGNGAITIEINKRDKEILEKMRDIVCKELKVTDDKEDKGDNSTLRFCSKQMMEDVCRLLSINPGKKSFSVQFPSLKERDMWAFIRGLFDGDGSISRIKKRKCYTLVASIGSSSKKMIEKIKNFVNLRYYYNEKNRSIVWSNKNAMFLLDKIYKNSTIHLDRKYNRYLEWKKIFEEYYNIKETKEEPQQKTDRVGGFGSTDNQ